MFFNGQLYMSLIAVIQDWEKARNATVRDRLNESWDIIKFNTMYILNK